MSTETLLRIGVWLLIGGVLLMRIFFMARLRRAGERLTPDHAAIRREGRGIFLVRVAGFLFVIIMVGSFALNAPWIAALTVPFPAWIRAVGFLLGLCSLVFWTWTQIALGTRWSPNLMLRKEHTLVTTGPYSRIRHPLYAAMTGWSTGLALLAANWVFLALAVIVSSVFIVRVPKEEKMLLEEFGEEYQSYMRRTGSFFPRL
jgi:protein-S-isoprenylcysteine O-methyltransferase Ste14